MPCYSYTINGQWQPTITSKLGDTHLMRLVAAGPWRILHMQLMQGSSVVSSSVCTMRIIARDGIFQSLEGGAYPVISSIFMMPGQRSDVAIQCNQAGSYR